MIKNVRLNLVVDKAILNMKRKNNKIILYFF